MSNLDDLPVLLVSAADVKAAEEIMFELLDGLEPEDGACCVWPVHNKYYSARVRVALRGDDALAPPHLLPRVEAHLVYVQPNEVDRITEVLASRAAQVSDSESLSVRLVVSRRPLDVALSAALREYEPVALEADETSDDEDDEPGPGRVMDALHAHTWSNLQLHMDEPGGEGDEWSGWQRGPPADDEFARVLAALSGAREASRASSGPTEARGAPPGPETREARDTRLARAETLMRDLAHALGTTINDL